MKKRPVIYVRRITNLSDARYCAGMGVDLLGFAVNPTDQDYVNATQYQAMSGWIAGPTRVAEISSMQGLTVNEIMEAYAPQLLHVPLDAIENSELLAHSLIVEVPFGSLIAASAILQRSGMNVQHVLVTQLQKGVAKELTALNLPYPILLAVEEDAESVSQLLEESSASGICLQGTREEMPGLKDYDHLSTVLESFDESD